MISSAHYEDVQEKYEKQPMVISDGCPTAEAEEKLTKTAKGVSSPNGHKEASLSFSAKTRYVFRKTLNIWRTTCRYYLLSFLVVFGLCSLAMLIFGILILTENGQKVQLILHWYEPPIKKLGLALVVVGTFNLLLFCPLSFYRTLINHRVLVKLENFLLFMIIISELALWFNTVTQMKAIETNAMDKWGISMKIFETNCSLTPTKEDSGSNTSCCCQNTKNECWTFEATVPSSGLSEEILCHKLYSINVATSFILHGFFCARFFIFAQVTALIFGMMNKTQETAGNPLVPGSFQQPAALFQSPTKDKKLLNFFVKSLIHFAIKRIFLLLFFALFLACLYAIKRATEAQKLLLPLDKETHITVSVWDIIKTLIPLEI